MTHTAAQREAVRKARAHRAHQEKVECATVPSIPPPVLKDGTRSTVRLWLRDLPPLEVPCYLYLGGRLALHHEIAKGEVLNTRALVISHVRTGMRIYNVHDGREIALKVIAALSQAGREAWDFGEFGPVDRETGRKAYYDPRVQAAMDAAMVVMHGEGWRDRYTRRKVEGNT